MKRKVKPWQEKVDQYCLKYLEVYRKAHLLMAKAPQLSDLRAYAQIQDAAVDLFCQHPELREEKTICLKPEFVEELETVPWLRAMTVAGEHAYPKQIADLLEMMQRIALFPSVPPEIKMGGYLGLASIIVLLGDWLTELRKKQYGAEPLDESKILTLAAQFFEEMAQFCRGRLHQSKGRHNLELVRVVRKIQEHQTEAMTPEDLRQALTAAGVTVPEGDTWRIWLWRARREGLIPQGPGRSRSRHKQR